MIIAKTKYELNEALGQISLSPGKLALIPTMGNLHQGHLSLVKLAKLNSSKTITTIFVNPLQFGKNDDFDNYPRTIEQDIKKLNDEKCDILFLPKSNYNMIFQKFNKLNQDSFTINIEPEAILEIDDIADYNAKEGLALNNDEVAYLNTVSDKKYV